jgi:hydroxymethylbilane synthase
MMVIIGSRKSRLAMWQAEAIAEMLAQGGIASKIIAVETKGDKIQNTPIAQIGGRGVFTEEIEELLRKGQIDIAVHSAKDMPSQLPEEFSLIAFTKREKVNDVLISNDRSFSIEEKGKTVTVGTSSVRRVAMLRHFYPHVRTVEMRGNLQTRIKKMESNQCDALMLAYAGVKRMNYDHMIVKTFAEDKFVPPVGQGSIAVEAASSMPEKTKTILRRCVNDPDTETLLLAERSYLRELQGGCSIPVFAFASLQGDQVSLTGGLVSLDGKKLLKKTSKANRELADKLGIRVGKYILDNGGDELLAEIRRQQER